MALRPRGLAVPEQARQARLTMSTTRMPGAAAVPGARQLGDDPAAGAALDAAVQLQLRQLRPRARDRHPDELRHDPVHRPRDDQLHLVVGRQRSRDRRLADDDVRRGGPGVAGL